MNKIGIEKMSLIVNGELNDYNHFRIKLDHGVILNWICGVKLNCKNWVKFKMVSRIRKVSQIVNNESNQQKKRIRSVNVSQIESAYLIWISKGEWNRI